MKRSSSPSSPRSAPAPDLALRPSRLWRGLILVVHAAALLVLPTLPWPKSLMLLLAAMLLVSLRLTLRATQWTRLVAAQDGGWWLLDRDGRALGGPEDSGYIDPRPGGAGLRHPWLVTLPLRLDDGRRCVISVWADAVAEDDHVALRRWLAARR